MSLLVAILALTVIYLVAWRQVLGRNLLATGPALFLAIQLVAAVGLIQHANFSDSFDRDWVFFTVMGLGAFVMGAWLANRTLGFDPGSEVRAFKSAPLVDHLSDPTSIVAMFGAVLVSLVAGYSFAARVGYNTFQSALKQLLVAGSVDRAGFTRSRIGATQDAYVAAGYTLQFIEIILPAIAFLLYIRGSLQKRIGLRLLALGVLSVDFAFLTVTGGRKSLLVVLGSWVLLWLGATGPLPPRMRRGLLAAVVATIGLVSLFGLLTVLQGRNNAAAAPEKLAWQGVNDLYNRIGGQQSADQLRAITRIRDEAPVLGKQWIAALDNALPGRNEGVTFDQRLHGMLFGNTRGNFPLNVWGSLYYNWGVFGLLLIALMAGYLFQRFTIRHLIRAPRRVSTVVLISLAGYRLALATDPYSALLQGGITLVILHWILVVVGRAPERDLARAETPTPPRHSIPMRERRVHS